MLFTKASQKYQLRKRMDNRVNRGARKERRETRGQEKAVKGKET